MTDSKRKLYGFVVNAYDLWLNTCKNTGNSCFRLVILIGRFNYNGPLVFFKRQNKLRFYTKSKAYLIFSLVCNCIFKVQRCRIYARPYVQIELRFPLSRDLFATVRVGAFVVSCK